MCLKENVKGKLQRKLSKENIKAIWTVSVYSPRDSSSAFVVLSLLQGEARLRALFVCGLVEWLTACNMKGQLRNGFLVCLCMLVVQ